MKEFYQGGVLNYKDDKTLYIHQNTLKIQHGPEGSSCGSGGHQGQFLLVAAPLDQEDQGEGGGKQQGSQTKRKCQ